MDRPVIIGGAPAALINYQLVTIAADNAANLQAAIESWRFGAAAEAGPGGISIFGFDVGAAGDGGFYYATITVGPQTGVPETEILIEQAVFLIREGGTGVNADAATTAGDLNPAIGAVPTGAIIQSTFIEDPLFDKFEPVLIAQLYEFPVAGCNAGRRFVLGFLFEVFGGPSEAAGRAALRRAEAPASPASPATSGALEARARELVEGLERRAAELDDALERRARERDESPGDDPPAGSSGGGG